MADRLREELKQKNELLERSGQQRRLSSLSGDSSFIDLDPRELVTENRELKDKVERYQQDIENCRQQNQEEVRRLDDIRNDLIGENISLKADKIKLSADLKMKCIEIETIVPQIAEKLMQRLAEADAATRMVQANGESILADLNSLRIIATKAPEDCEAEMALRSTDASPILQLNPELKTIQQSRKEKDAEIGKLMDQINQTTDMWKSQLEALTVENDKLRAEQSDLQCANETLLNQIEQLNNQVFALQNNSNIFALDEANQEESTTGALSALKGLSKEKAQLKRALEVEKLRNQELLEKLVKYENDTKVVNELANKAEGEVIETQSLRKELESWKAKAHSLTQQLKNFGADSFKRLMAEKKHLSKQATVQPSQPPQSVPTSVSSSFPSSIEVSEASTSESQANQFSLGPTTSTGGEEKNKRTFDDDACDEPSTSSSLKKFKSAPMISTTITTAGQSDDEAEPDEEGESELREYEEQYDEEDGLKVVNEDEEQSESEVDLAF